jgi:hypothetical protein
VYQNAHRSYCTSILPWDYQLQDEWPENKLKNRKIKEDCLFSYDEIDLKKLFVHKLIS